MEAQKNSHQPVQTKMPMGIKIIIGLFIYQSMKVFDSLFLKPNSIDSKAWQSFNIGWLNYLMGVVLIIGSIWLIYLYFKRKARAYKVTFYLLSLMFISTLTGTLLNLLRLESLPSWYIVDRLERGIPITAERAEILSHPGPIIIAALVVSCIIVIIALYIYKKRSFFVET